jgi:hypothetical protein
MPAKITTVDLDLVSDFLAKQPETTRAAAKLAINDTANRKAMPRFRRTMEDQVSFPSGYLNEDRFAVRRLATEADLTATISARHRPTSLARFAQNQNEGLVKRQGGARVRVNPGGTKFLKGSFFVRLRRGRDTGDGFNLGLAIRLQPGETLRGRRKGISGVQLAENLYLLYGPSVDQVFSDVSVSESPFVVEQLEREFLRQYVRLSGMA